MIRFRVVLKNEETGEIIFEETELFRCLPLNDCEEIILEEEWSIIAADRHTGMEDFYENDLVSVSSYICGDLLIKAHNAVIVFEEAAFCLKSDEEGHENFSDLVMNGAVKKIERASFGAES